MTCYIISYDLRAPDYDYSKLYDAIKGYGTWAHVHDSVWAIVTDETAVNVRDKLMASCHVNDRIFVIRSGTEAAWRGTLCNNEWLHKNL